MKAAQVSRAGGDFELVERDIPQPGRGEVRIKVQACGICHSDAFTKQGLYPGITYPRVPGHEVVGVLDVLGEGVSGWTPGQRVGVGWHGGHCFTCESCRTGDFILCDHEKISGVTFDGGYADHMIVGQEALVRIPDALDAVEAAPLLCAGITTYNALRHSPARAGDLVAVQGIGGLGHLAVQFAHKMGFHTVAVSRGADKKPLALDLGATDYIDATATDPAQALMAMGGARVILATAPNGKAIESVLGGLAKNGQLSLVAAFAEPISILPLNLIGGRRTIQGWPSGHARDSEDTLNFSALSRALPRVETFPLDQVNQAYQRMITNQARFRVVLTMD